MKRRSLLSTLAVMGTGVTFGAGIPNTLLKSSPDLMPTELKALNVFEHNLRNEFAQYTTSGKKLAFQLANPSKIVYRKETKKGFELKIKNHAGSYVTVISKKGNTLVKVTNE